ncbi:MBL fold metallo-hydrolase [Streptococcus oralis]|uniref:Metallo-beta-lactamase superfamily protein n=1 Tax=Streptococcus oralis TaxID=1303 RepID=A0A139PBK4_STROR|nr:MBL fold metallo-hydrolase [Streptococcus oralis]KXT85657.1 Metallo-beta-lactamase superfamily protein [Streptococcus oralis]
MAKDFTLSDGTKLHVFTADEMGFMVTSTLVVRKQKALLIGARFRLSDGREIVEYLKENKLELEQIFIIHGDPDYYFGLEEVKAAFPEVVAVATPFVVEHILATVENKLEVWRDFLGDDLPKNVVIPSVMTEQVIEFQGTSWKLYGSEPSQVNLWNEETKTLIGGVNVFNESHLFLADTPTIKELRDWQGRLRELLALDADLVVVSHGDESRSFDNQALQFSLDYIEYAIGLKGYVQDSETFKEKIQERFPNLRNESVLDMSAKVMTGEMVWG